jgi:hypothetical protein
MPDLKNKAECETFLKNYTLEGSGLGLLGTI